MQRIIFRLLLAFWVAASAFGQNAQPLTLKSAVQIALERSPLRKSAIADVSIASAACSEVRAQLLPHVTFSETAMRGSDPVYVFGTRLRQSRFTAADFALNRLNRPNPIGGFTTSLAGDWQVLDLSRQAQYRAARFRSEAASRQLERNEQETVAMVVAAYYGLLLAQREADLQEQAVKTADAVLEHSRVRVEAGLTVQSDLLAAQVNQASRQQELIRARNNVLLAQAQLATALGIPSLPSSKVVDVTAEATPIELPALGDAEQRAVSNRSDLKRLAAETAAQGASLWSARATLLPRLIAFGSWQADNVNFTGNGANHWTAGAEVRIDLFSGGGKLAHIARERAQLDRVEALRHAAEDQIRLELRRAYFDHDSARQMLQVAQAAVAQSEDALAIVQNRYDSGLTTVTDLLRAEDAARGARTNFWQAVYNQRISWANLEFAMGTLNINSAVVTQ